MPRYVYLRFSLSFFLLFFLCTTYSCCEEDLCMRVLSTVSAIKRPSFVYVKLIWSCDRYESFPVLDSSNMW